MRSVPVLTALVIAVLSLPALAATGEREARSTPAAQGGATLPEDSTVPRPPAPPLAAPGTPSSSGTAQPAQGGASAQGQVPHDRSGMGQSSPGHGQSSQGQGQSPAKGQDKGAGQYAPDNTGRNRQHDTQLEADDQSNDPADVKAVSTIRRALTDDSTLSLQGHNVKIIVQGGRVTLRGPVKGEAEKRKVEAIVRKAAGKRQVVNELEATGS